MTIQQAGDAGLGAPGTDTRDFLQACDERTARLADWNFASALVPSAGALYPDRHPPYKRAGAHCAGLAGYRQSARPSSRKP